MSTVNAKPLGGKAYGSIPHLIGSKAGPGEHNISEGQHRICTDPAYRSKSGIRRTVYVQEKLDGSNVCVARIGDDFHFLTRSGWPAQSSPYRQHQLFAAWCREHLDRFAELLAPGERACGEWLAQAHGTRYQLPHDPFVVFDIMEGQTRSPFWETHHRATGRGFTTPRMIACGDGIPIEHVLPLLQTMRDVHGSIDDPEGAVWRVEQMNPDGVAKVEFLAKYVRPDFVPGRYLPEISGLEPVWNWEPA